MVDFISTGSFGEKKKKTPNAITGAAKRVHPGTFGVSGGFAKAPSPFDALRASNNIKSPEMNFSDDTFKVGVTTLQPGQRGLVSDERGGFKATEFASPDKGPVSNIFDLNYEAPEKPTTPIEVMNAGLDFTTGTKTPEEIQKPDFNWDVFSSTMGTLGAALMGEHQDSWQANLGKATVVMAKGKAYSRFAKAVEAGEEPDSGDAGLLTPDERATAFATANQTAQQKLDREKFKLGLRHEQQKLEFDIEKNVLDLELKREQITAAQTRTETGAAAQIKSSTITAESRKETARITQQGYKDRIESEITSEYGRQAYEDARREAEKQIQPWMTEEEILGVYNNIMKQRLGDKYKPLTTRSGVLATPTDDKGPVLETGDAKYLP